MSDRILVLHEGRITAEIPRSDATEESVMYAATGNVRPDLADEIDGVEPAAAAGRRRWLSRWRPRSRPGNRRPLVLASVVARQRELSLVAIMVVLGGARRDRGAAVPDRRQPQPGRGPRLDHRDRRDRRGARRHHPQHRPLGRGDDGARRLLRRDHAREPPARRARGDRDRASAIGLGLGMVNGLLVDGASGCRRSSRRSAR